MTLRVGEWTIEPLRDRIVGPTGPVRIEPRAMQVLVFLAGRPGEIVSREEILDAVWSEKFITDEVLTNAVAKLRKALGDDPKSPRYIQTVPNKGYRLIAKGRAPRDKTRFLKAAVAIVMLLGAALYPRRDPEPAPSMASRPVPVTSDPRDEYSPALSPDGSRVAFVVDQDVYVQNVGGGLALQLTDTSVRESSPTWTPDGQHVTFSRQSGARHIIYTVSALGGPDAKVAELRFAHGAHGMSWAPDGETLAYVDRAEPNHATAVFLLNVATGDRTQFTNPPADLIGDELPKFSPDGERIAFARRMTRTHFSDVYVKSVVGRELVRLTSDELGVMGLDWSPDSESIIYSSDRNGPATLYRVAAVSGRDPEMLPGTEGWAFAPSVARARPRLVYRQGSRDFNVWRGPGPLGEGTLEKLIHSTRQDRLPAYSPDGTQIAFSSNRTGAWDLWLCDADGRNPVRITNFGGFAARPNWTPDGESLLFHGRHDGLLDVYRIRVDSSVPVRLTQSPSNDAAPSSSRDGKWIYFNSDRSGSHQIYRMTADGNDAVQVTRNGGVGAVESLDGAFVYYSLPGRAELRRVPPSGGAEELVLSHVRLGQWTLNENGIAFFDDASGVFRFYAFASRAISAFGAPTGPLWNGLSLSPDGRWILFPQNDAPGNDIMMIDAFR